MTGRRAPALLAFLCLAVVGLASGCSGAQKKVNMAPVEVGPQMMDPSAVLTAHAAVLPADVIGVAVVDMEQAIEHGLLNGMGAMPDGWNSAAMRKDLGAFSKQKIGFDFTQVSRVILYATERQTVGALLEGQFGSLQGKRSELKNGVGFIETSERRLALVDLGRKDLIGVVIDPEHAQDMVDIKGGSLPTLAGTPRLEAMSGLLTEAGNGHAALAVHAEGQIKLMMQMATGMDLDTGALVFGDGLVVKVKGDPGSLKTIEDKYTEGVSMVRSELKAQMDTLGGKDFVEGTAAILAWHLFNGIEPELAPKIQGDIMTMEANWSEAGAWAPLAGILAAIAIPAFTKYTKQSKASEANMHLKMIADGLATYYQAEHYDAQGVPLKPHFPASVIATPAPTCCSASGDKCAFNPSAWDHPTWRAARFSLSQDHYYTYEIVNNGLGKVTVIARGDLDCDGVVAVLMVDLTIDPSTGELQISPLYAKDPELILE